MKKSLRKLAKVAAGLGAAYALTKMRNAKAETTKEDASVNQYDSVNINKLRDKGNVIPTLKKTKAVGTPAGVLPPSQLEKNRAAEIVQDRARVNKLKSSTVDKGVPGIRVEPGKYIIAGKYDKLTPNKKFEGLNYKEDYVNRGGKKVSADTSQKKRREQLDAFDRKVDAINKANFKHGGMSVVARGNKLARSKPTKIC